MGVYSIKDLENLSGIKAHTLRMWELRYNFIKPKRTPTNIRYYDDDDLKLILNVALLRNNGFKISRIAMMSERERSEEALSNTEKKLSYPAQVQALSLAMIQMDERRFEKILATNILQLGFEKTMLQVIFPFFHRVGILWQTGAVNSSHEHFMTHLVRQKLLVAIDGQVHYEPDFARTFMLFLPEGEMHELSLLFANYIIKARQHKVIYLGQDLPLTDLKEIYALQKPHYLAAIATTKPNRDQIQQYINELAAAFPEATLLFAGKQALDNDLQWPVNSRFFRDLNELIDFIDKLNRRLMGLSRQ